MKAFSAFKDRRLPDIVRYHASAQLHVAQINIGFGERFHEGNIPRYATKWKTNLG